MVEGRGGSGGEGRKAVCVRDSECGGRVRQSDASRGSGRLLPQGPLHRACRHIHEGRARYVVQLRARAVHGLLRHILCSRTRVRQAGGRARRRPREQRRHRFSSSWELGQGVVQVHGAWEQAAGTEPTADGVFQPRGGRARGGDSAQRPRDRRGADRHEGGRFQRVAIHRAAKRIRRWVRKSYPSRQARKPTAAPGVPRRPRRPDSPDAIHRHAHDDAVRPSRRGWVLRLPAADGG